MTSKADFTEEQWKTVLGGPPSAGLMVLMAQSGGSWSEMWAMSKAYAETRQLHGESELLDAVVAAKPEMERPSTGSQQELQDGCLANLRDALAVLDGVATVEEVDDYKRFVVRVAQAVAAAHREGGRDVSPAEQQAVDAIASTLGVPASG